jgi:hypothetical protein
MMGWIYACANHVIIWLGRLVEEDGLRDIWRRKGKQAEKMERTLSRILNRGILTMFDYGSGSLLAFRWLRLLAQQHTQHEKNEEAAQSSAKDTKSILSFFPIIQALNNFFSPESESLTPSHRMVDGLFRLFTRTWFSRVWVIQEVVLATKQVTVQCGKETLPLEIFMAAHEYASTANLFRRLDWTGDLPIAPQVIPSSKVHVLAAACSAFRSPRFASLPIPEKVIEALLDVGFCLNTSNPFDTIYGMLGMINATEDISILKPDYSKPIKDFMIELVRYLIESTGTLKILQGGFGKLPPDVKKILHESSPVPLDGKLTNAYPTSEIPSWVPTGKTQNFSQNLIYPSSHALRQITYFRFSEDGRSLNITARSLGVITWVASQNLSWDSSIKSRTRWIWEIKTYVRDALLANQKSLLTNESVLRRYGSSTAIIRHLIQLYSGVFKTTADKDIKRFEFWLKSSPKFDSSLDYGTVEQTQTLRSMYYTNEYISRFEIFVTSEGYIGRILWEGEDQILFQGDWRERVMARESKATVYYVPGCAYPLLVGRSTSQDGSGEVSGGDRCQVWATCALTGFLGLEEDKHMAVFEDKEKLESIWLD